MEKLSARQQLRIKTINSNSWFIEIKKMLIKYNLPDPEYYLHFLNFYKPAVTVDGFYS
jgi:hypothetical protein